MTINTYKKYKYKIMLTSLLSTNEMFIFKKSIGLGMSNATGRSLEDLKRELKRELIRREMEEFISEVVIGK